MSRMNDLSTRDQVVHVRYPDEFHLHQHRFPISSDGSTTWDPSSTHASRDSSMWKKPQDTRVDNTMDSISDTQDAAHLLLTAASALTSLTRQSSSPPTVDTRGGSFFIGERSLERQQPRWAMKDVVVSTKKSSREKAIKFPVKLMNILSCEEYQDIISWMPDGQAFVVKKPKAFVTHVLPLHFKEVKFSSFTRKLHRWGFTKMLRGKECGAYCHKDFQRGCMDLCMLMRCCDRDGTKSVPNDDMSLSSSEARIPVEQKTNKSNEIKSDYPLQEARQDTCDQIQVQYDHNIHTYSSTMIMPMPQLPEHLEQFPGPGGYWPPMSYYDWNAWVTSTSVHNAGPPARDYNRMIRSGWSYPVRNHHPKHRAAKECFRESQKF